MLRLDIMIHLSDKKCVACEGGTPPLGEEEINELKERLKSGWEVVDNKKLRKEFKFSAQGGNGSPFAQAMDFVNKAALIAENEEHHPDIYIFYNIVKIELSTHAIGGLSENDFILAAKIDNI